MVTIKASPLYKEGIQCSNPFEDGGFICEVEASSENYSSLCYRPHLQEVFHSN